MITTRFSEPLDRHLAAGLSCLSERFLSGQRHWLSGLQGADGGFPGRASTSDLYYTGFAARCADVLGTDDPRFWNRLHQYLYTLHRPLLDASDVLSLLVIRQALDRRNLKACCPQSEELLTRQVLHVLETFRHPEGGYSKTRSAPASLYQTFLAALCYQILEQSFPETQHVAAIVQARRGANGGFSDLPDQPEGTNPTAAAMALLGMVPDVDAGPVSGAVEFLINMLCPEGGFAAGARAPQPDLMSTFTAMVTLFSLGVASDIKLAPVGRFVRDLALPNGGFAGTPGDRVADVEYTYYGLGTLALLAAALSRGNR